MDKKYIAQNIPFTPDKMKIVKDYREQLEKTLGFKVSLSDAVIHAMRQLADREAAEKQNANLR